MEITASPVPTITITPPATPPTVDTPATFTVAAAATAPATVRTITVDFGDGTSPQTFGNTTSVAHTYRSSGTFTVTATVEDTAGSRSTGSTVVVVQSSAFLVVLAATPSTVATGAVVNFTATVTQNPGNIAVQSVTFTFGDGNGARGAGPDHDAHLRCLRQPDRHSHGALHQRPHRSDQHRRPGELKTLFDADAQREVLARLDRLTPASTPRWGSMDVAQMLCHVARSLQTPTGALKPPPLPWPFRILGRLVKGRALGERPMSRNAPTSVAFKVSDAREFANEKAAFLDAVRILAAGPQVATAPFHVFFGPMTPDEWGRLMLKHIDHHFTQFGV